MSSAQQANQRPAAPLTGGADEAHPVHGQLAAIERAFAAEREAALKQIEPREQPRAKVPLEAIIIGLFVAISFLNAALTLFR